ncbi:MAG: HAMP domain-containing protein [Chloroflexi bacterium]|nr:HAMP domain-containing protein [Chloroflexota bacterium]
MGEVSPGGHAKVGASGFRHSLSASWRTIVVFFLRNIRSTLFFLVLVALAPMVVHVGIDLVEADYKFGLEWGIVLVAFLPSMLVVLALGRRMTVPIRQLHEHALAIGRGEFDRRVDAKGPIELAGLARAFNRMADEVQVRHAEVEAAASGQQFLSEASATLSSSLDYDATLQNVAHLAVPSLADVCAIYVAEGDEVRQLAIACVDAEKEALLREMHRRYPPDPDRQCAIWEALHTGEVQHVAEATDEFLATVADDDAHQDMIRRLGAKSLVMAPMVARGQTVGAILLGLTNPVRHFGPTQMFLCELLARRAGLAIDNARLYREAETARRDAELHAAQLTSLLDNLGDMVVVADASGRILVRNRATSELTGIEAGQVYGMPNMRHAPMHRTDGTPLSFEDWPINRTLRGECFTDFEFVYLQPDGSGRRVVASGSAVRDEEGRVVLGIVVGRDITPLRELEKARDEWIHTISHDLRTPLTVVQGQSQLLLRWLDKAGLAGREKASAVAILRAARQMNNMIQDLVDSARLESGQLRFDRQIVDLGSFLDDLIEGAREGIDVARIDLEVPKGLPPILADPSRLERVLMNLFTNALKYSPSETRVTIGAEKAGHELMISVEDRGVGIPREELHHVFERYFRARTGQIFDGLGLGLYITRALVEAHGGRIWVESEEGRGSTFKLTLPLLEENQRV